MDKALKHLHHSDPILAGLINTYPKPKFEKHNNYYQELIDSIIGQQLSVKAAHAIESRFKDLFGGMFPTPEHLLEKDIEELRAVGLSRPKARYIQDLARNIIAGEVTFERLDSMTNDEIISELTKVKGIGEWTVHMFLIFCMARLDVLPVGDLGIKNGIMHLYGFSYPPSPDEVRAIADKNSWHPYESVVSWYVWQSLGNKPVTTT